ncbi:SRPBCC family protein [Dactylosporangium vinaceum]|uniref:SRPBCC family protein n=1 Tax=Dactylosporangium vinaceum TaxID=53362 RepID=A0ABV5M256_9ACTN|nr:SRPBCC family protein [Dactylosporangium vinaceum]UAB99382.1 SRPBCC family protein [Dactylosporangium vinaceum]
MASVTVETIVAAGPDAVWAAIADVGNVHRRLLPGRVSAVRIEGDERILTMPDGTEVRELIVAVDHEQRRMSYSVQGPGRLELRHHHAAFQVFATDDGARSRLVWITDVLPHDRAPAVAARVSRGIEEMRAVLESA